MGKGAGDDRDVEEPQGQELQVFPLPFLPPCSPSDAVYLNREGKAHL